MATRVAVDIGGTFTDVVAYDDEDRSVRVGKTLSTPADLIQGVLMGLEQGGVSLDEPELLIHGSTVVINALIERKGARAALVTTRGFRDIYGIGRINRPDSYNRFFTRHRPLIGRERTFEIAERMRSDGTPSLPLDPEAARAVARELRELEVEAVAVLFLHAYKNPEHELAMGRILRQELPGCFVTLSHELSREYREFERVSTVAANAFVGPLVSDYLGRLEDRMRDSGSSTSLAIMQSNGGVSDVETTRRECVQMMESGPAGGVVGTIGLCAELGYDQAIAFDMGGTTAKAAVVRDLTFPQAPDYYVGGYATGLPIRIPCLDIKEVGTGGGSVAWADTAGGLHVGPRSAGAHPGPACYGQGGTEPTVTDASVVLGLLSPEGTLSGGLPLEAEAAATAIARLGEEVGLGPAPAAAGILAIAAASMANAVRAVTSERGLDPREFALVAYGGNGPLHISLVARELGTRRVVIPQAPSVFSALGMLMADVRRDTVLTDVKRLDDASMTDLEASYVALEDECREQLTESQVGFRTLSFLRAADMRYVGQEHTVTVSVGPDLDGVNRRSELKTAFDLAHGERFSHSAPMESAELVSLRVSALGSLAHPSFSPVEAGETDPPADALAGTQEALIGDHHEPVPCTAYERSALLAGNRITGPAVIREPTTATLLRPGDEAEVDSFGNLLLTIGA